MPRGRRSFALFLGLAATASAQAPAPRAPGASPQPPIERHRLANGLAVWLVEHHDVPIVQISLVVPKGTGDDPPGQFGIASLTASMLVEGGGSRSASDIAEAVDRLKGNLAPAAGVDALSLQLHVTADGIVEALPILADVFERPTFPADAIERVKRERLSTLRQARDDPDAIGSLAFSKVVYGSAHRYGTALIGAAETIARFTREDLRAFHAATYRPETTTLIAAGDIVPGEMLKLLELNFGGWRPPAGPPQDARPIPVPQASPRRVVIVDKPGAPQTRIYVGGVGAPRVTPDFFALQVMSALLRARLTSRLGNAAAGVRAGFDMRKAAGPFVASAAVRVDSTADALAEFDSALAGMQQAPGGDELARARDDVALRLPTFESTGRITARLQLLESLLVYGLADNYYSTYVQAVRTVGAEEVARAAAAYLRPDRLSIVIVGDERAIGPGIRAMKLGPVTTMAVDEVFAPPIP